jgi:hypothetical protein
MRGLVRGLVVASLFVLTHVSDALACPMCKMALETDDPQPKAYMYSILFMLIMICSIFGAVATLLVWLSRQERLSLEASGYQHLFENGATEAARDSRVSPASVID